MAKKKYRLGNQSGEYELSEDYLGWLPLDYEKWVDLMLSSVKNTEITISHPQDEAQKVLFLHYFVSRDALPMDLYLEQRAEKWYTFAIVSEIPTSEKFIIPLH